MKRAWSLIEEICFLTGRIASQSKTIIPTVTRHTIELHIATFDRESHWSEVPMAKLKALELTMSSIVFDSETNKSESIFPKIYRIVSVSSRPVTILQI